ncbi:MAG: hypothetical protein ACKOEX_03430 [Planctomycetia bacterium]
MTGRMAVRLAAVVSVSTLLGTDLLGRVGMAAPPTGFRELAPGTLTVIPADAAAEDTVRHKDLVDVTVGLADMAWTPKQESVNGTLVHVAKNRDFAFDVWCLEFAFKLPRLIDVQVPVLDQGGKLVLGSKRCWYLIYRVRNVGGRRTRIDPDDPTKREVETFETPIRFMPHFVLESLEGLTDEEGLTAYRAYLDRIVPAAMGPIRQREDPARRFLDSAQMAEEPIAPGQERWGVAVWEDVDPRFDFFSIFVQGLTNAIDWKLRDDGAGKGAGELSYEAIKSLRLDFWRPGDARRESEDEMSIGYAGIFERMALGTEIVHAIARPAETAARPADGFAAMKLDWADLVEPADGPNARFVPLVKLLRALAALPTAERPVVIRDMVGDLGAVSLDELLRLLPPRPGKDPLESLATLVEGLVEIPDAAGRRRKAVEYFGAAAPKLDWLAKEVIVARQVAALDEADVHPAALENVGPQQAFAAVHDRFDEVADAGRRERLILGLFGPRGADLYADATKQHEGIDHAWVFRYENADSP